MLSGGVGGVNDRDDDSCGMSDSDSFTTCLLFHAVADKFAARRRRNESESETGRYVDDRQSRN